MRYNLYLGSVQYVSMAQAWQLTGPNKAVEIFNIQLVGLLLLLST